MTPTASTPDDRFDPAELAQRLESALWPGSIEEQESVGREPAENWTAAQWREFSADLKSAARTLDGQPASIQRVQARLDREFEVAARALLPDSPWRAFSKVLKERLYSSPLLRLAAASLVLHLAALPVLAYFWWREEPRAQLHFELLPAPEVDPDLIEPQPLENATLQPEQMPATPLALDQAIQIDEALRLDRFRRSRIQLPDSALLAGWLDAAADRDSFAGRLAEICALKLAQRALPSDWGAPPPRLDPSRQALDEASTLGWLRFTAWAQAELDRCADAQANSGPAAALAGERAPDAAALLEALQRVLPADGSLPGSAPGEPADANLREQRWGRVAALCADLALRATEFGLLTGGPEVLLHGARRGSFPGDPRVWLELASECLPEPERAAEPFGAWLRWARRP